MDEPRVTGRHGERIVVYTVALPDQDGGFDAVWRLGASISTLRAHNRTVPVVVFVFGEVPSALATLATVHGVELRPLEPFRTRLAALSPAGWPVFVGAPLLARLLVAGELAALGPRQVLLCDHEAVVHGDVDELFAGYPEADLVAREELHCDRSAHGVDRSVLNQPLLAKLAAQEGLPVVPPFDPGIVLLNNSLWCRLATLQVRLVDYAWRLAVGATMRPDPPTVPAVGIDLAAARATDDDVLRALPFPSVDERLLVEVAWWLTLGHVDGLTTRDFAATDVALDPEVERQRSITSLPKNSPAAIARCASGKRSKGCTLSITGALPAAANAASMSGNSSAR